tara:strand:+ start:397 stop:906 length:510 start_codon:yes stop_codon:yes gene_type:complete
MFYKIKKIQESLLYILMIFFLDQGSKYVALFQLTEGDEYISINNFLNVGIVWNYGFVFGFLSELNIDKNLIVFSGILILFAVYSYMRGYPLFTRACIVGGALGNMFDRLYHGAVLDVIDLHVNDWHYPTFNIADCFIVGAVIYVVISEFKTSNLYKSFYKIIMRKREWT